MSAERDMQQMKDIAVSIASMLNDKNADMQTTAAALAMLLCSIGKEMGMPLDDFIEAFARSAEHTYALKEETLQ